MEADTGQRKKFEVARAPPVRIKDAVGGNFNGTKKELETIYGMLKRVQIVATVLESKYTPASQGTGEKDMKSRLHLDLDDGTGIMAVTWFGVVEDEASKYEKGDMVIAIVRPGEYKNSITFNIDGIRKLKDLSDELHHKALILKKLKQLADAKKPLTIPGGGRITNTPDDASKFFTTSKTAEPEDMSDIEQPVQVGAANKEKIQFTSRIGEEETEGEIDGKMEGSSDEPGDEGAEGVPAANLEVDEDIIKGTILDTIMQPEYQDGITIEQLVKATNFDRKVLARILKIMENERNVEQVPSKPGTYRGK